MKIVKPFVVLLLLAATFAGGYFLRGSRVAGPQAPVRRVLHYVDPMHPAYTSDRPGIAPDCGMALEPVYADQANASTAGGDRQPPTGDARPMPAGTIRVAPERQQTIGVKFDTVELFGGTRTLRAVGTVTADETRIGHVHTRFDGWIERVFVNFTGDVVRRGDPMLTIYSPEMLASQQELLLAVRARDVMRGNPLASAATHGESLFEAARRRLQFWDLSDDQIQQVLRTGEPIRNIEVRAPMDGFVTARNAFPNQKITSDTDLYTITGLDRVWIIADVTESDLSSVREGATASLSFPAGGAPRITARVTYIQPQVDATTRTVKVRLEAANPGLLMKPDMYVNVEFEIATASQLTIPAEALLDTGNRQTVFVDLGDGYLEPRAVVVGQRMGDRVAIVSGLTSGERVVSSGTFLIDSESQLKAAASGMGAPHQHVAVPAPNASPAAAPAGVPPSAPTPSSPNGGHGHD